jgi:hypothetical protein
VACKRSGLLGVDEDRPGAFTAFAASIGQVLEPTFTVRTAKGCHFYYRQLAGAPLGNSRGQLAGHGIDIRGGGTGDGGYLVGPGSVHETGVLYTPVDSAAPIIPVPGWLAEVLRPAPAAAHAPRGPVSTFGVLRGLVGFVLGGTPGVDRNDRLFWAACRAAGMVAEGRVDQVTAEAVLVEAALRAGLRGGEPEARRTVASGLRAGARLPDGGSA